MRATRDARDALDARRARRRLPARASRHPRARGGEGVDVEVANREMRDVGRAVDAAPRAARAATVCGARRGDRAVVGPSMTARDAARDAFAAESRESDARGGDSERPGTPGRETTTTRAMGFGTRLSCIRD